MDPVAINGALCEALGIDPAHVKEVAIRLRRDDVPLVEVTYSRRFIADHPEIISALAHFKLVPEDDDGE